MSSPGPINTQVANLQVAAKTGQRLGSELEQGQAASALSDHFARLASEARESRVSIAVLGLTSESRDLAVAWLIGTRPPPDLEEAMDANGLVWLSTGGETPTFSGDDEPRVTVDVNTGRPSMVLAVLASRDLLTRRPLLPGRLGAACSVVLVAGPCDSELDKHTAAMLAELVATVGVLWPVINIAEDVPMPVQGWWVTPGLAGDGILLPSTRVADADAAVARFLAEPDAALCRVLWLNHLGRRLAFAADMLVDRQRLGVQALRARQEKEIRLQKHLDPAREAAALRTRAEKIRESLDDNVRELTEALRESGTRAMLPTGTLRARIKACADALETTDLSREAGYRSITLRVDERFAEEASKRVRSVVRTQLKDEAARLESGLRTLAGEISDSLATLDAGAASIPGPKVDADAIWTLMRDMFKLDLGYRGELKKRGFLQRLSEGRRMLFIVLMSVSILSLVFGSQLRDSPVLAVILVVVFVGAIAWSYRAWKREDQEALDKELERVRKSLESVIGSAVRDAQREKESRLRAVMDEFRKDTQRQIREVERGAEARNTRALRSEESEVRERIQALERRLAEGQQHAATLQAFSRECERVAQAGRALLA